MKIFSHISGPFVVWLAFATFWTKTSCADDAPPRLYVKPIATEPRLRDELLAVPLDSDVYAVSHAEYHDLQVVDDADRVVPYLIRQPTTMIARPIRMYWVADDKSLRVLDDGLEITLTLEDDEPRPEGIRIITPLKNFEQRVQVFGLAEGESDEPLVTDALIFDYSRYMDVRRLDIEIPETPYRRFRVVIDRPTSVQESQLLELKREFQGGEETGRSEETVVERRPFRIDRIDFWMQTLSAETEKADYPLADVDVTLDKKTGNTHIAVAARRQPLTAFTVITPNRNFNRPVTVQIPEVRRLETKWFDVGGGRISHLDFRDLHDEELTIEFNAQREPAYRLIIENGDNPPLQIDGVDAAGPINEVVFLASPNVDYRLKYGLPENADPIKPPQYDTAAIRASLSKGITPLPATLGSQAPALPADAAPPMNVKGVVNNPWFLGTLVVVLVAALTVGLYYAARRFEKMPHDEQA